jgi:hypothetical protein
MALGTTNNKNKLWGRKLHIKLNRKFVAGDEDCLLVNIASPKV